MSHSFEGTWTLILELSQYQIGQPPLKGTYTIKTEGNQADFTVAWVGKQGESKQRTTFGGVMDGTMVSMSPSVQNPNAPDSFNVIRVDDRTLNSSAFRQGERIAFSCRIASYDGNLLSVMQEGRLPDGGVVRNFQMLGGVRAIA